MNSYDDMDDEDDKGVPIALGCFPLVLAFAALLLCCFASFACKSTPPTFNADIRSAETGKVIAHITATYDPGLSWMQANLGPVGAVLSSLLPVIQALLPATAAAAVIP